MITEKIGRWEPISDLPIHLYIDSILEDHNGLTIIVRGADTEDSISFVFKKLVNFQNTIESCTLQRLEDLPMLSTEWPLFIISHSSYVYSLTEQSFGIINHDDLLHYIITHGDGIIDIVTYQEPVVKWTFSS